MKCLNKLICFATVISLILPIASIQAFASELNGEVGFDRNKKIIEFSGTSNLPEQNVTLRVYNTSEDRIVYANQTKSDSSAEFVFEFPFSEAGEGTLEFIYNCTNNSKAKSVKEYFKESMLDSGNGSSGSGSSGSSSSGKPSGGSSSVSGGIVLGGYTTTAKPYKFEGYADVPKDHWATQSINSLTDKGVINGMGDNMFAPDADVTREQFVTMIVNAFEIESINEGTVSFEDVEENKWYYSFVRTGFKYGIINGISDSKFGIGSPITRQDACVIVNNTLKALHISIPSDGREPFLDGNEISDYAQKGVNSIYQAGIINGVSEGVFAPHNTLTRAMAAVLIDKTLQWR